MLLLVAFSLVSYVLIREASDPRFGILQDETIRVLMILNALFMINRMVSRVLCVLRLYGWRIAILAPIRWPLANLINLLATARAIKQYTESKIRGTVPKWVKTDHELPEGFGIQEASRR